MASSANALGPPEIPITVTVTPLQDSVSSKASSSIFLGVALENISAQPLSLLRWSSPLDPRAGALGVFNFTSKSTGEQARGIGLKIGRKIPHSATFAKGADDIITIGAGEKAERTVEVAEHEVELNKGEAYVVKAKGRWMGVWLGGTTELSMNNGSVKIGQFESTGADIVAPG